jgi:hypothetical protein
MKKLVLLLAIFCTVSVSMAYASDIKKQKKEVTKIENALIKAATSVCISDGNTMNFPKPILRNTPEQCAIDAWDYVYSLVNIGYSFKDAYADGKRQYQSCVSAED